MIPSRPPMLSRPLVSLVVLTACIAGLCTSSAARADLFDYVNAPDDAYKWELREATEKPLGKVYDIHLVSQVWQGITWEHQVQVYEPREVTYEDVLPLMITGGGAGSDDQNLGLTVAGASLIDRVNALRGLLDTFAALYPQIQEIDFREDATRLDVPVYIVTGAYEARGRAIPAQAWFGILDAPSKEWIVFEHSGHRPHFEEPAAFAELMQQVVATNTR